MLMASEFFRSVGRRFSPPIRSVSAPAKARRYHGLAAGAVLLALGASQVTAAPLVELLLVKNGTARAVVVVPDHPEPSVTYAAEELVTHVAKASGARLAVVHESEPRDQSATPIFLGDTRAARALGIDADRLPVETFVLRTTDTAFYIAGNDVVGPEQPKTPDDVFSDRLYNDPKHEGHGDPLNMNTSAGTLFGVYDWLEHDVGVRWLWPGELGTYVPSLPTIIARPYNQKVAPHFFQRAIRPGLTFELAHPALGFTAPAAAEYAQAQTVFLRRHRMGRGQPITYHHAFVDWWEKYGHEHPDWFQLNANGTRGPEKPGGRFSMSVSNPELVRQVVDLWKADPTHPKYINAVENDTPGLCTCADCRAADGPPPPDYQKFTPKTSKVYGKPFVTDRYVKFWLAVQQLAAKTDPDVNVVGYAYFNYFEPPTSGVKLNPHIVIGFCPSSYWYPRSPEEHAWFKQRWTGWSHTGARVFSRTNYFLDGYCMPYIFAHQFADDFQHEASEGMAGTDFDSLTGSWATQGPTLYLLMRLHTDPALNVEQILAEYYAAFGPAMKDVQAYFDYWEKYLMTHRELLDEPFTKLGGSRWRAFAKAAHAVFPDDCFGPAEEILARAAHAAAGNADAEKRVQFLRDGLTHARLCQHVSTLLTLGDPTSTPERGAAALRKLLAFRRAHEREWIDNFNAAAWNEDASWKLSNETRQSPDLYP
jgi:hypothetical protein